MRTLPARVQAVRDEATDIRSYDLVPLADPFPSFTAGAHIDLHLADLVRQYSLCNDPAEIGLYRIAVQRELAGRGGSMRLFDEVREGSTLTISEPRNHFALDEQGEDYLLIAGGIGATPLLAMAQRLLRLGKPFRMHYLVRSRDRLAFRGLTTGDGLLAAATRIACDDEHGPPDIQSLVGTPGDGRRIYCCGPTGLMDAVKLATAHWPAGSVVFEHFSPLGESTEAEDRPFEAVIASSGDTLHVPTDKSLLSVLVEHGISIDCSCTEGLCGTCEVRLLEGEADHRDVVLSDEEKAANDRLMVCVSRARGGRLVLDL